MNRPVIVIGAGGHAKVLVDAMLLAGVEILGLLDCNAKQAPEVVLGVPVLGDESLLEEHHPDSVLLVNAVGSVMNLQARRSVYEKWRSRGYEFTAVAHPGAIVSEDAEVSAGVQVLAGAVVGPGSFVGENTIVNTNAVVDHDCWIGAHCHIAPGAALSGGVVVGVQTHVGVGSSVIQNIRLGGECLVAAGAVVVQDVPDTARVRGVPAGEW
jgi:UDP-perosamine 4-acetyltransferase